MSNDPGPTNNDPGPTNNDHDPGPGNTFGDLLQANAHYASTDPGAPLAGVARAGVGLLTCMDSRIDPLAMVGLGLGDATVLRTPGGRLTADALTGLILGVSVLGVTRIMVVQHTRCAMAQEDQQIRDAARARTGADLAGLALGAVTDQLAGLRHDVARLRAEPLIGSRAVVGAFLYDVDTRRVEALGTPLD